MCDLSHAFVESCLGKERWSMPAARIEPRGLPIPEGCRVSRAARPRRKPHRSGLHGVSHACRGVTVDVGVGARLSMFA